MHNPQAFKGFLTPLLTVSKGDLTGWDTQQMFLLTDTIFQFLDITLTYVQ